MPPKMSSKKSQASNSKECSNFVDRLSIERGLYARGASFVAGIDEAGRGPLAGPVVAAAVMFSRDFKIEGIRDSKKLSPKKREFFFELILKSAIALGVGIVPPEEIDKINIRQATLKAMREALLGMNPCPDCILIDGIDTIGTKIPEYPIKGGDDLSLSIGAASIVAKVTRDQMMIDLEKKFPAFSFSVHKGYGTAKHYEEIRLNGPTPAHRKSFLKTFHENWSEVY